MGAYVTCALETREPGGAWVADRDSEIDLGKVGLPDVRWAGLPSDASEWVRERCAGYGDWSGYLSGPTAVAWLPRADMARHLPAAIAETWGLFARAWEHEASGREVRLVLWTN